MDNNIRSEKFKDLKIKLKMKSNFILRENTDEIWGIWIQNKINNYKYWLDELDKEIEDKKVNADKNELKQFKIELKQTSDLYKCAVDLAAEWNGIS